MLLVSDSSEPKRYPDIKVRLNDQEKVEWQAAAKEDGFDQLGTWIKKVARDRIKQQKRENPGT